MLLLPAPLIAVVTAFAGLAWILFARSQAGRFQAKVFPWMCLPFFVVSAIYTWFSFGIVEIEIRAMYARIGIVSIALPQAIILIVLSLYSRGTHESEPRK